MCLLQDHLEIPDRCGVPPTITCAHTYQRVALSRHACLGDGSRGRSGQPAIGRREEGGRPGLVKCALFLRHQVFWVLLCEMHLILQSAREREGDDHHGTAYEGAKGCVTSIYRLASGIFDAAVLCATAVPLLTDEFLNSGRGDARFKNRATPTGCTREKREGEGRRGWTWFVVLLRWHC